jgi:hypothetical protein
MVSSPACIGPMAAPSWVNLLTVHHITDTDHERAIAIAATHKPASVHLVLIILGSRPFCCLLHGYPVTDGILSTIQIMDGKYDVLTQCKPGETHRVGSTSA